MNSNLSVKSKGVSIFFSLLVFSLCTFSAFAQTSNDTTARQQIRLLNQQMEEAFNNNDMAKVAAFYSDDSEIVYDNGYTVKGRANLDSYWASLKDKGRGWNLTVVDIGGGGDLYYQLGNSDLRYMRQDKESRSVTNFVLLWKKQPDGSFKIYSDYLTKTAFAKN